MRAINRFLLDNNIRISHNPCISPDFCLDWPALRAKLSDSSVKERPNSRFETAAGRGSLLEDETTCDCAWKLSRATWTGSARSTTASRSATAAIVVSRDVGQSASIEERGAGARSRLDDLSDAGANLGRSTLGIGARFTTLHWPAVDWAMSALNLGVTANQNSIPRELVYDVDAMLEGRLDTVPFPFIGTSVPEGHQGQSVEGMSHGCVLVEAQDRLSSRGASRGASTPIISRSAASSTRAKTRWSAVACWPATSPSISRRSSRRRKRRTTRRRG